MSSCVYSGDNKVFAQEQESDSDIICRQNDPEDTDRNLLEIPIGRATDQAEHLADGILSKIDIIIENAELQAKRAQQLIELVKQCGTGCLPKCDHIFSGDYNEDETYKEYSCDSNNGCVLSNDHGFCPACSFTPDLPPYPTSCQDSVSDCGNTCEYNCSNDNCDHCTFPTSCPGCDTDYTFEPACDPVKGCSYFDCGSAINDNNWTHTDCRDISAGNTMSVSNGQCYAIFRYNPGEGWCLLPYDYLWMTCYCSSGSCDECNDKECYDCPIYTCDAGDCYCESGTENTTCPCPYTSMDDVLDSMPGIISTINTAYDEILAYYNDFGVDDVPANSEWTTAGYISFYSDYYNDLELKVMPKLEVSRQRLAECVTDPQAMEEISAGRLGINKLFSCSDLVEQIGFSTTLIYSYLPDADGEPKNYIEEGCYGNSYCHAKYIEGEEDDLPYPAPCAEDYYCCSM